MRGFIQRSRSVAWASLLALVVLGAFGVSALAAEAEPTITKPGSQSSVAGTAIAPVTVTGTNLATLTAKELPVGLELTKVSEAEWTISGTPTTAKATTVVTLEATNKEATGGTPVTFEWTVAEAAPTIAKPGDQSSVAGTAIAPVTVTGTNLATLTAKELPAGLELTKVSEAEWTISGTPTTAKATTTVTLEATNKEATGGTPVTFEWTVAEAAPTIAAPANQVTPAGRPIVPVIVTGTNLHSLTAKELPAGLLLTRVSETEWTISGTPTTAKAGTVVTLEATNKEATAGTPVTFEWTIGEPVPVLEKPADQTTTVGKAITAVAIKGSNLAVLIARELPAGLELTKVSETEWTISGTPTTAKASTTVTLEASNKGSGATSSVTLSWTVLAPEEAPAKPPAPTPTPTPTIPSAGRLGTVPAQKQGRELFATFLCEVATCKVSVKATITVGKTKIKIHSSRVTILQGKKARIPLRLNKSQRELIAATLKKRKKVTAALSATIASSVGLQVTRALTVTVKR